MRRSVRRIVAVLSCLLLLPMLPSCGDQSTGVAVKLLKNKDKISYCGTYTELSDSKANDPMDWRDGMISGNGEQGFIESGAPYSDSLIFQHVGFVMPSPDRAQEEDGEAGDETAPAPTLAEAKKLAASGEGAPAAAAGAGGSFHPGGALRIRLARGNPRKYIRFTDYETGEVGVSFSDENGSWERRSFTSMADNAVFTRLGSESGERMSVSLSFDDISVMAGYGAGSERDCLVKRVADPDGDWIAFVGHYPDQDAYKGSGKRQSGWFTFTYIINDGGTRQVITSASDGEEAKNAPEETDCVRISDAYAVYLITISAPADDLGKGEDFAAAGLSRSLRDARQRAVKLSETYLNDGYFDYDAALVAHSEVYDAGFGAVTLTVSGTTGLRSNETMLRGAGKKSRKGPAVDPSYLVRMFYAGRWAQLCGAGRTCGMWTGEFGPGNGAYELNGDALLQAAGLASANSPDAAARYAAWLLSQAPGWETFARDTHGVSDALQAPAVTDGETLPETGSLYWNAGASMLLRPLYEAVLSGAVREIPLEMLPPTAELKDLLELDDDAIEEAEERGTLLAETQVLLPLLQKTAVYWLAVADPAYLTNAEGGVEENAGKKAPAGEASYALLPGTAPGATLAFANESVDVAACRDALTMLLDITERTAAEAENEAEDEEENEDAEDDRGRDEEDGNDEDGEDGDKDAAESFRLDLGACRRLLKRLPSVTAHADEPGFSSCYPLWPAAPGSAGSETEETVRALLQRKKGPEDPGAAALEALAAVRLGDRELFGGALRRALTAGKRSVSLLPSGPEKNSPVRSSALPAFTAAVTESLLRSDAESLTLLPCLLSSGMNSGSLAGVRTLSNATVSLMSWDLHARYVIADVYAGEDQTITVTCPLSSDSVTVELHEGETRTVSLNLDLLEEDVAEDAAPSEEAAPAPDRDADADVSEAGEEEAGSEKKENGETDAREDGADTPDEEEDDWYDEEEDDGGEHARDAGGDDDEDDAEDDAANEEEDGSRSSRNDDEEDTDEEEEN